MTTYVYPGFIADERLKRLHAIVPDLVFTNVVELRKRCDIGDGVSTVSFEEALRLYSEEAFRTCGVCLQEGGEVSNWKERAETAEANVRGLQSQLVQSDKLAADWKKQAETAETKISEIES